MNENIVDRGRTNTIGNEGLDASQNPINIFEWNNPDTSSTPVIQTKSPYSFKANGDISASGVFNNYRPPIGIPTFWFTSVIPDWALDCTDGAGGSGVYDFADFPELDNAIFKQFLADFSGFGASDDTTHFTMPDLGGVFPRIAGTNLTYVSAAGTVIEGGTVGDWQIDATNNVSALDTISGNSGTAYTVSAPENGAYSPTMYNTYDSGNKDGTRYRFKGIETKPVSFSLLIIVRIE